MWSVMKLLENHATTATKVAVTAYPATVDMSDTPTCWQLLGRVSHSARIFDACLKMPRLVVDSAARNPTLFPDADRYELELPSVLKDVSSVTLLKTDVLFSDTLIGLGQDRIVVDGADGVHEILLAHEDHTGAASLATSLQAALDTQYPTAMVSVAAVAGERLRLSCLPRSRYQTLGPCSLMSWVAPSQ